MIGGATDSRGMPMPQVQHFPLCRAENSGWLMGMTVFNLLGGEYNGLNLLIFIYLGAFACPSFKLKLTACCQSRDIWQGPSPKLSIFNLPDVGCSDSHQCMRSDMVTVLHGNFTLEESTKSSAGVRSMRSVSLFAGFLRPWLSRFAEICSASLASSGTTLLQCNTWIQLACCQFADGQDVKSYSRLGHRQDQGLRNLRVPWAGLGLEVSCLWS